MFTIIAAVCLLGIVAAYGTLCANAQDNLARKLSGRILLQVEARGEAWYVNPVDLKRYYLGRPLDAFNLMRIFGLGISDVNLSKLSVGIANDAGTDRDSDGLSDDFEKAVGTDPDKPDTDGDGYDDKTEIATGHNPLGNERLIIDNNFSKKYSGRIFLAVESKGEAWYVNPVDLKRYYLGRPLDAFNLMRNFGLGITNNDMNSIATGDKPPPPPPPPPPVYPDCATSSTPNEVMITIADAVRKTQISRALSCFTPDMRRAVEYTINFLDNEGRLILGNIVSGSKQSGATADQVTFNNEVYFSLGGYKVPLKFYVKKQPDGRWLLSNL